MRSRALDFGVFGGLGVMTSGEVQDVVGAEGVLRGVQKAPLFMLFYPYIMDGLEDVS